MFTAAWLTLVMIFAVGTVPFQPLQTAGLCLAIMASYVFFAYYAPTAEAGVPLDHLLYLVLVGILCSAMSSALYESRYAQYRSRRKIEQMQDQLVQKEKLASLGHWTAGIAHEIKNPLNFVNNFAKMSIDLADELEDLVAIDDDAGFFVWETCDGPSVFICGGCKKVAGLFMGLEHRLNFLAKVHVITARTFHIGVAFGAVQFKCAVKDRRRSINSADLVGLLFLLVHVKHPPASFLDTATLGPRSTAV